MTPNLEPKKLFLIDCIGAIVSAFSLGVVLPFWQEWIGLPLDILYYLAYIACVFAVYSLVCFITFPVYWRKLLKGIATANALYAIVTIALMFHHASDLLPLGVTYFVLEVLILAVLVRIEWKTAG